MKAEPGVNHGKCREHIECEQQPNFRSLNNMDQPRVPCTLGDLFKGEGV